MASSKGKATDVHERFVCLIVKTSKTLDDLAQTAGYRDAIVLTPTEGKNGGMGYTAKDTRETAPFRLNVSMWARGSASIPEDDPDRIAFRALVPATSGKTPKPKPDIDKVKAATRGLF